MSVILPTSEVEPVHAANFQKLKRSGMSAGPGERGASTIFFLLTALAMLVLLGLLVDLGRIRIAQYQLRRAAHAAARSVMADYESGIRSDYGLYLSAAERGQASEDWARYVMLNLAHANKRGWTLIDYRYESGEALLWRPISDPEVLRHQILEEMKYRAPVDIGVEFFERLRALGQMFKSYDKAKKNGESLKKIDSHLNEARTRNWNIKRLNREHKELRRSIEEKEKLLEKLRSRQKPDQEAINELKQEIARDKQRLKEVEEEIRTEARTVRRIRESIESEFAKIEGRQGDTEFDNRGEELPDDEVNLALKDAVSQAEAETRDLVQGYRLRVESRLNQECPRDALNRIPCSRGTELETACDLLGDFAGGVPELPGSGIKSGDTEEKNYLLRIKNNLPALPAGLQPDTGGKATPGQAVAQSRRLMGIVNSQDFLIRCRDELYINEFIVGKRNDSLRFTSLASSGMKEAEQETIICGSAPAALAEIWLIRFALDTPAYYVLVFKVAGPVYGPLAAAAAGAVQGLIDLTIMLNPDMAPCQGKVRIVEVMIPGASSRIPPQPTFDYRDHLRILALMHDTDQKLQRIKDVIEARRGLKLDQAATAVYGQAKASFRLWFWPLAGLKGPAKGPFGTEIREGRCYLTVDAAYTYN